MTKVQSDLVAYTIKKTLLRAADIIDKINEADVLVMQTLLLQQGVSLENVAKVDRAMVGTSHLRAIANDKKDAGSGA